jgi:hypothetical protein
LLILVLVCGGAFAGPLGVVGWGLLGGGCGGMVTSAIIDYPDGILPCSILAGAGLLVLLLDLAFDSGSSTALAPPENPVLEHVSFGVAPNAAYVGACFHF